MGVAICNIAAWVLCGVMVCLLLFDFIKTEKASKNDLRRDSDGETRDSEE